MADLAGFKGKLPAALDGGSLKPMLLNKGRGDVKRTNPFLIFHQAVARNAETSLILGNYKLVKTWNRNQLELFDLSHDLSEANDLSKARAAKTKELHTLMVNFLSEVGADTRKIGSKAEVYEGANPL